jgi:hypothetical protein
LTIALAIKKFPFLLHKSGAIMLRRAREVEAAAIHALLWSAKEIIPLVEAFHTEPYRKWVENALASFSAI